MRNTNQYKYKQFTDEQKSFLHRVLMDEGFTQGWLDKKERSILKAQFEMYTNEFIYESYTNLERKVFTTIRNKWIEYKKKINETI